MGPTGQALVRCWCSMFKRGTNSRRSWYRWWAILSWGKAGKKSVFTGLLGSWVCFSWWPFPKSTYSVLLECSWTISQDSSSGLCWSILTSVCPFTLVPFSLSFLSHVLFLPSTLPPSFAHLQQITQHNDYYVLCTKKYFGRGYLVAFFLVKFLLLISKNKKWRSLSIFLWIFFSYCSFPSSTLVGILHWWAKWTISVYHIMCKIH